MKNTTEEKREAIPNSVSRMLLAGIGVLLQVLWIFWLALKLNDYSTAIQVCHVGADIFDYAAYIWTAYQLRV